MYFDGLARRVRAAELAAVGTSATRESVTDHMAEVYLPLHEDVLAAAHTRYYLPGGRGSAKSSFVSLEMVAGIMREPGVNGIVFRRYGVTLRDSVYSQVAWAIDELGVGDLWRGSVAPMQWTFLPTGQTIAFRGLDDSQKLKSIRPPAHGTYAYIWFEEYSEMSGPNQVRSVLQSVMRGPGPFRVFCSFNPPRSRNNWANVSVLAADDRALTFRTDYRQIPAEWLGEEFLAEAAALEKINEQAYRHEYLGEAVGSGGEVYPNVEECELTDEDVRLLEAGSIFCGIDWGFSVDPAAFVRLAYDARTRTITLLDEIVARGVSNEELANRIKAKGYDRSPGPDRYSPLFGTVSHAKQTIICDSAEPKSVADMRELGLRALPCQKYPGSVAYGTRWLQGRTIRIDPRRTPVGWREFSSYQYATTRDGEYTTDLPDRDNHVIDSVRYALDMLINDKRESA